MGMVYDIVSWTLIVTGSLAVFVGGIGVLRFPDVYTRMHAASVTDTVGAWLLLIGLMVHEGLTLVSLKLALIMVFFFFTTPTASFALAHAAMTSGVEPLTDAAGDEVAAAREKQR